LESRFAAEAGVRAGGQPAGEKRHATAV
jgi:hypothetical protein